MTRTGDMARDRADGRTFTRNLGRTGRVALTWAVAGGLLSGGFLVAGMTLAGRLSGFGLLLTSSGLFVLGALLGFTHGGVLGYLGRPPDVGRREALGSLAMGALYAIPALAVAWLVAGWIAMTTVAAYVGSVLGIVGVALAWATGAVLLGVGAAQGWRALRGAYAKWSHGRVGTTLVAALFGGLLVTFLAERPEIWGLSLRVTPLGAVLLALAATLWLGGPIVTAALALLDRLPDPHPGLAFGGEGRAVPSVLTGLVVGVGMAALALPFYGASYGFPTAAGAGPGAILGTAIVDEIVLRLFVVTGVVWLLLRGFDLRTAGAAAIAIGIAALAQVLVYLPGVLAIGFPSPAAMIGFIALTVLVPAIAFGILFWRRGLGTALVAHATTLGALFLLLGTA